MKDFAQELATKYPDLFPKDKDGNVYQPDCGIYCPEGWQGLVDNLCACIDSYVKHNKKTVKQYQLIYKIHLWFWNKFINKPCYHLAKKIFNPFKDRSSIPSEEYNILRETTRGKLDRKIHLFAAKLRPNYGYRREPICPVTIAQIKEKFGGLRFYADGGDDHVHGMISFAESLSYNICENCWQKGESRAGGWVVTLCDECHKPKNKE